VERHGARRSRAPALEAVRSPAAGQGRDRRMESLSRVLQSAAQAARARTCALPEVADLAGADIAETRTRACRGGTHRRRASPDHAGGSEYGLVAFLCVEARARSQGSARAV